MSNVPWSFYYNPTDCPCKNCKDRHVTCHSECEKYKHWQETRPKVRQVLVDLEEKNRQRREKNNGNQK